MQVNHQLANEKAGSVSINAKWLDFSSFEMEGQVLEFDHPKIAKCFEQLAQHGKQELLRMIEDSMCISNNKGDDLSDTPYNRVETIGFHGPVAVGLDGKGITLKDVTILVDIDYKYYLTDLDGVSLVEHRNDVIDCLEIVLQLGELTVRLTGVYDYSTETR